MKKLMFAAMALFTLLAFVGCGGGSSDPAPETTVTSVTVSPATANVEVGKTSAAFSAEVLGENDPDTTVTWSLVGEDDEEELDEDIATFDPEARKVTVADDEALIGTKFRVKATSTVDTEVSGYAVITIIDTRVLESIKVEAPLVTAFRQYVGIIPADIHGWAGLKVFAVYDNEDEEELADEDGVILDTVFIDESAVNINTAGTYKVKVTYEGIDAEFDVDVKELTGIRVVSEDVQETYYQYYHTALVGIDDITVWAMYEDFDNDYLLDGEGDEAYTVNTAAVNFNTANTYKVAVAWKEKTADIDVTVVELSSINAGDAHIVGDTLPTGLALINNVVVHAKYADNHEITITDLIVAGELSQTGPVADTHGQLYTITITWHTKTTTFTFLVTTEEFLSDITISGTYKTTYYQYFDTAFDPTGVIVTAHYSQSTPDGVVTGATFDYNDEIFTQPGMHDITVVYHEEDVGAGGQITKHIKITVVAATRLIIELEDNEFKVVPTPAMALEAIKTAKAVFSDTTQKDITLTESMIQVDETDRVFIISWHGIHPTDPVAFVLLEEVVFSVSVKTFRDIGVGFEDEQQLGNIRITGAPVIIVITGAEGATSIQWFLNNVGSTGNTLEIDPSKQRLGRNVVSAVVVLDGVTYRKNFVFTIVL